LSDRYRSKEQLGCESDVIEHHPAEELYDLQTDPYELNNIADKPENKPVLRRMREQLNKWMLSQNDPALKGSNKSS
jgi:arylsulfatase A-like enzyme